MFSLYPEDSARISNVVELVEVPGESMRVCRYTLSYNWKRKEQSAVIYRPPQKSKDVLDGVVEDKGVELSTSHARVRLASFEIIQSRLAHLTPEGRFAQIGQPVGRTAMIQSMREILPRLNLSDWMRRDQERLKYTHGISDIEPTGECMAEQGGELYSCPMLVEMYGVSDGLLVAPQRVTASARFNFKRMPDGGWSVADDFAQAYILFLHETVSKL